MIKTLQLIERNGTWEILPTVAKADPAKCQLALVFGSREGISRQGLYAELRARLPKADLVFASTAGEIIGKQVVDDTITVTGLEFEHTTVRTVITHIRDHADSRSCGEALMAMLPDQDLTAVLVFSDGNQINGTQLTIGLNHANRRRIPITGGLAGDAARFEHTFTGLNERIGEGKVVAVGLYGKDVLVGHGSFGGWDEFGPERVVTSSAANVLFTVDGRSALGLYKEYLGAYSEQLPGSALLFPLSIRLNGTERKLVRTILAVDEENDTMTFAGDMPVGAHVRLMKANFDKLIDAAATAANDCFMDVLPQQPEVALLISCVGRKLILQDRVEEEVEAAQNIFGPETCVTGFYSYGEISPFTPGAGCELHNQTMTITTLSEV
jgi:hypothetical protein